MSSVMIAEHSSFKRNQLDSAGKVLPKVFPRPPEQLMDLWLGQGRVQYIDKILHA